MPMTAPWSDQTKFDDAGLHIGGVRATALAERFGTPLLAVDEDHLRRRCRAFLDAFPRVLWAVKAFPLRAVIRAVLDEGAGLLAATGGEVDACLRAGAPAERLVLHGNNKLDTELEEALDARVGLLIADNSSELERLSAAAEVRGVVQRVLMRIAPAIDVETHAYIRTGAADTKFGTPIAEGLAMRALERALELPGLDVAGIHLHVGSQLLETKPYLATLDVALGFLAEARERVGFEARLLDIGGGMGTTYTDEDPVAPEDLARELHARLREGAREGGIKEPELVVEPGRALTSGATLTLYRVGSIKEVPGVRAFVAVDGGMSDNLRPALYGSRYTVALASRASDEGARTVTVVGRHCESGDVLARDIPLPSDLARGDLLAFASTGAYEYAMASNYNRVGRPAVVMVGGGEARLVARRETYDDLARLEVD